MKTALQDRVLWFDGTNEIEPQEIADLLLNGVPLDRIVATRVDDNVEQYNHLSDTPIATRKLKNEPLNMSYQIPREYADINLEEHVLKKLEMWSLFNVGGPDQYKLYVDRAKKELQEIRLRGMEMMCKTIIYVIDEFKKNSVVWGVGRGSSCASLVLFILGLHKVDPVRFSIPMTEFFHD